MVEKFVLFAPLKVSGHGLFILASFYGLKLPSKFYLGIFRRTRELFIDCSLTLWHSKSYTLGSEERDERMAGARPLFSRKLDTLYFVFFMIHLLVVLRE